MVHQYYGSQAAVTGQGGMSASAAATFSLFFPLPLGAGGEDASYCSYEDHHSGSTVTPSVSPSSSTSPASSFSSAGSVVDCTLSLGPPSSRRAKPVQTYPCPSVSAPALTCWDAATAAAESYYYHQQQQEKHMAACRGAAGHDQFLDRRCANCGTSSTPLWRNGPRGPKSLCNACGIRFKKEERRAAEGYNTVQKQQQQRAPRIGVTVSCTGDAEHADASYLQAAWRRNVVVPPARASFLFQHN